MRIYIINSPLIRAKRKLISEEVLPPLGLGYIASFLKLNSIEVSFIDAIADNVSYYSLLTKLNKEKPNFIGINIFSTNYKIVKDLVESLDFDTHVIIGGLSTKTLYPKIITWDSNNQIDVIIGDGELILTDIVNCNIKEETFVEKTKRRVFNINSKSIYFVKDISSILLDRKFFQNEPLINIYGIPEVHLVTSRGCIYNCSFCAAARSLNKDYLVRERSTNSIIEELSDIKRKYPETNSIRILDDLYFEK